jgi:hypothetical protein
MKSDKFQGIIFAFVMLTIAAVNSLIEERFSVLDENSTPEEVVRAFLEAVEKGDLETIKIVHDPEVWENIPATWDGKSLVKHSNKVLSAKESKDRLSAVVEVRDMKDRSDRDVIPLRKTDKGWKITCWKPLEYANLELKNKE